MKKIVSLILILTMSINVILTGCDREEEKPEPPIEPEISVKWSDIEEFSHINVPYLPVSFEANVMPYSINEDLSNIENAQMLSGFSEEQIKLLVTNGFVVLPGKNTKIYDTYNQNKNLTIPNFITSDSVLHTYHQYYDKSLFYIEGEYLVDDLKELSEGMLVKSIKVNDLITDPSLVDLAKKNIAFFLVAKMLMAGNTYVSESIDRDIIDLAKKEYKLIQEAEGFSLSPLFETELDYSQFKVRGHYTKSADYERFFKTMMWYGLPSMPLLVNEGKGLHVENTQQVMLLTYTVFVDGDTNNTAKLWNDIYAPTSFFVGLSDDITFFELKDILIKVLGENPDMNQLADKASYGALFEEIIKLRDPKINAKIQNMNMSKDKPFRFMGQRYVLDSDILQGQMDPVSRPVPSGLDVMGILGSQQAEKIIFNDLKPQEGWPQYEMNYKQAKEEIASYDNTIWQDSLYNGWLWVIKTTLKEFNQDSKMPYFMTNDAWKNKTLNTALGNYTELKHDTILYGEQSGNGMGGPEQYADAHYVEPNVELYSKLLWLMEYSTKNLQVRGLLNEELQASSDAYISMLRLLINCSIKELNNSPLSEEDKEALLQYGDSLESINNGFIAGTTSDEAGRSTEKSSMVVTDIVNIGEQNLSMATGLFDEIYVVVPVEGKLYLTRGSIYSFYEFVSESRLRDEDWWVMNGLLPAGESGEFLEVIEPSELLPQQPFWTSTYKLSPNTVEINAE